MHRTFGNNCSLMSLGGHLHVVSCQKNETTSLVLTPTSVIAAMCGASGRLQHTNGVEQYSPARSIYSNNIIMAARHERTLPACHWTHIITFDSPCVWVCVCIKERAQVCCVCICVLVPSGSHILSRKMADSGLSAILLVNLGPCCHNR